MNESDLYVDSEEDEVFFGSINEKEINITSKLVNDLGWNSASEKQYARVLDDNNENKDSFGISETSEFISKKDIIIDGNNSDHRKVPIDLNQSKAGNDDSLDNEEYHSIHSNNTSVELDHNYSYTKQKIDESILATPKSVVKADKDGGFLKVLSEIALVKAEADNKLEVDKMVGESNSVDEINKDNKGDEDKENKIGPIPELRVIEATPEKHYSKSPQQGIKLQARKFKLVYNSPQSDADGKQNNKSKSFTESQVTLRNSGKKSWNKNVNVDDKSSNNQTGVEGTKKSRGNSWPNATDACNESINLIDLTKEEETPVNVKSCNDDIEGEPKENSVLKPTNLVENNSNEIMLIELDCSSINAENADKTVKQPGDNVEDVLMNMQPSPLIKKANRNKMEPLISEIESEVPEPLCEPSLITTKTIDCHEQSIICLDEPESCDSTLENKTVVCLEPDNAFDNETKSGQLLETEKNDKETLVDVLKNTSSIIPAAETSFISPGIKNLPKPAELSKKYRFSKEARKIVEALKISTSEDTLNFTIPEINLEEMENSFLAPGIVSGLDDTILDKKTCLKSPASSTVLNKVLEIPSPGIKKISQENPKSVDKEKKCFSDRKILLEKKQTDGSDVKKCVRRLPVFDRTPVPAKGVQSCERKLESKIPISGLKPSKIPSTGQLNSKLNSNQQVTKLTPLKGPAGDFKGNLQACKTPGGSGQKSTKYRNIASPISAYIHNKPTVLVVNVKSQVKKDGVLNVMKSHAKSNSVEKSEKPVCNELGLPFVEYKSATPYKIEKCPKSRLPRLAPTMQKLIGSHSPRILKHKGRFYMKTPAGKNGSSVDATVMADHTEVSLVVSEVAQKSSARN